MSKQKKYHFIYKTTCKITGKFYVGMHSTDNLEDGYLGSGKILGYSRHKYGDENHKIERLEFVSSRDELRQREKEIVNEELINNPLNINLKYGGDGGWDHLNSKEGISKRRHSFKIWSAAGQAKQTELMKDPEYRSKRMPSILKACAAGNKASREKYPEGTFFGRKHSEETRLKMRKSKNVGQSNSQFGTCWVTDGIKPVKIKKEFLDEYLGKGYLRGRK